MLGQIVMILILVVIILVIVKVSGFLGGSVKNKTQNLEEDDLNLTRPFSEWKIQLLNEDGKVLKETIIPGLRKGEKFIIGREDRDFNIKNQSISRNHAEVFFDGKDYRLKDTNSDYGITYKGQKITNIAIKSGMIVYFSKVFPCRFLPVSVGEILPESDTWANDTVSEEEAEEFISIEI